MADRKKGGLEMKRVILSITLFLILALYGNFISQVYSADKNTPTTEKKVQDNKTPEALAEQTVYATKSGTKYHADGCKFLSKSKVPMKLKDAVKKYTPCSICNPPVLKEVIK